ncbi:MAG TPA: pyruvate dehydrogenase (acetyl-transferring), homodimeric type, partial [Pirellulales bacterium]|nr:pyruvate dehydrogenase (acetyl-transferring), homodimeric type [Pirellulales bacterium]
EEGVLRGMYKLNSVDAGAKKPKVQLLGSGAILREALRAQQLLAEKFHVSSDVWSVTSYRELRREAQAAERWNLLHPTSKPRRSYLEEVVDDEQGPWIASSDYVRAVSEQISPWIPGGLYALGTDGLGRSDLRPRLRRHFEVDAENIVLASLRQLARQKKIDMAVVGKAVKQLDIDPEKIDPVTA